MLEPTSVTLIVGAALAGVSGLLGFVAGWVSGRRAANRTAGTPTCWPGGGDGLTTPWPGHARRHDDVGRWGHAEQLPASEGRNEGVQPPTW